MDAALGSWVIEDALEGWQKLGGGEEENRLDRVLVYATLARGGFSLEEAGEVVDEVGFKVEGEQLRRSLRRLELAYVLGRDGSTYRYTVPLFVQRVREQGPEALLVDELKRTSRG